MSSRKLENYLRTYRKRAGLSQDEVAFLLGYGNGARISRHENFARTPPLEAVFGYQILFGADARDLFAGIFQKVETETLKRAQHLAKKLAKESRDAPCLKKLEVLGTVLSSPNADSAPNS